MKTTWRLLFIIFSLLALCAGTAGPSMAADQVKVEVTSEGVPIILKADHLTALQDREVYLGRGHIRIERGTDLITGDTFRVHAKDNTAEIRGNVVMSSADFKVTCKRLVVNLDHNIGKIYEGKVFFPANHYYISGDEIEKIGPESFSMLEGQATTCDGPSPSWTLSGKNIRVESDGYAKASHATFRARFMPLVYLPWIKVPVKSKRQSGLLMPKVTDSSRDGFTYTQPIYWAASDSKDMTLYLKHMADRGLETTIEARYNDWGGKGTFMVSYLQDQDPDEHYYSRPNRTVELEDRYWLRGMANMHTQSGFDVKMDLDYASDPNYLEEFEEGMTGHAATRNQLKEEFGRELAEPTDPLRKSTVQATKNINGMNLSASLEYTQNLDDPDNLDTIQRLPKITLDYNRSRIRNTPFFLSVNSEYTYFSRKTNDESTLTEEGHRLDVHPKLHWPIKFGPYLDLEPSFGVRETMYFPSGMDSTTSASDDTSLEDLNYKFFSRELYDLSVTGSTNISRVFQLGWGRIEAVKHRIRPDFGYTYVPESDQARFPYWDSVDRVAEQSRFRYGFTTYLVAKTRQGDGNESGGNTYGYREFLRFGVHRSYDFVEASRALEERKPSEPQDIRMPHSPWELDLEIDLSPTVYFLARSKWDTYAEMFTQQTMTGRVADKRGDSLSLTYEMHKEPFIFVNRSLYEYEEIRGTVAVTLNSEWSAQYEKSYSFIDNSDIESVFSLDFHPQCWGIKLEYSEKPDDRSIAVYVNLLGIGEVGRYTHSTESAPETEKDDEDSELGN